MYFFAILSSIAALANLALAIYLIRKNHKSAINITLALTVFGLFIWGASEAVMRITSDPNIAFFAAKYILGIGSALYPATFLHFWLEFSNVSKKLGKIVYLIYTPFAILLPLRILSDLIITGVKLESWGYVYIVGPAYTFLSLYIIGYFMFALILAGRKYLSSKGKIRIQTKYILLSMLMPYLAGIFTQAIPAIIDKHIPEFTITSSIIASYFISYAVIRHGLMGISKRQVADNIIQTIKDYIVVVNEKNIAFIVNRAFLDAIKYKEAEVIGKDLATVIKPNFPFATILKNADKNLSSFEANIRDKRNNKLLVLLKLSTIYDNNQSIIGYVYIMKNIKSIKALLQNKKNKSLDLEKINIELKNKIKELEKFNTIVIGREKKFEILKQHKEKLLHEQNKL